MRKPRTKTKNRKREHLTAMDLHALVWAVLTLAAYLVTFILAILLGAAGPLPFALAGLSLLAILILEAGLRGRLWIFEPGFNHAFSHPQVGHRLTYFAVGTLLVIETGILLSIMARG